MKNLFKNALWVPFFIFIKKWFRNTFLEGWELNGVEDEESSTPLYTFRSGKIYSSGQISKKLKMSIFLEEKIDISLLEKNANVRLKKVNKAEMPVNIEN